MAKQKRQPVKAKPITENPLFPAVVGLWFGALFGLGSLAVRPSLIENLVLQSRIDLVIPAAAPPLGITARILLALVLAAIGAVLGVALARGLTRPKVESKERKRGAMDLSRSRPDLRGRDAHASMRMPISVKDDLEADLAASADGPSLTGRRRPLAIEHEEEDFVPHDLAPLPGGAPQVLDIASLTPAPAPIGSTANDEAPFELAAFAQPPAATPAQTAQLDWQNAAPVAATAPLAPAALPEGMRQPFQGPEALPVAAPASAPAPCPASAAAHADGRQVFGMEPQAPSAESPRQIFGIAAEGDHVPQEFVRSAGFKTSVFETEEPQPLFERSGMPADALATPTPEAFAPIPAAAPVQPAPVPQAFVPTTEAVAPAPVPHAFEPAAPAAPEAPPAAPVAAEPLPSPASLGMTDLASRLAESMRRRRAARSGIAAESAPAPAIEAPLQAPPAEVTALDPAPAAPQIIVETPAMPAEQPVQAFAAPQPAVSDPVPVAHSAPVAFEPQPAPQPVAAPEPPAAQAPVLPSAMRPLALDAFLEEDAQIDLSILPPRHIAMPAPVPPMPEAAPPPVQFAAPPVTGVPAEPFEDERADDVANDAAFGSLLDLGQARHGFVRIEEPEADDAAPEPVVIFPGQVPLAQPGQAVSAMAPADAAPFRRFDSPAAAGQGQPVALEPAAPAVPSAEADQALRSALANLQRMSGAA